MATSGGRTLGLLFGVALFLTLASSWVGRMRLEVQDWDCPPEPASCARPMLVKGFPLPYIVDFHGISVVGSADLIGALMGEDFFLWWPFLGNVAIYLALSGLAWAVIRSSRQPRT